MITRKFFTVRQVKNMPVYGNLEIKVGYPHILVASISIYRSCLNGWMVIGNNYDFSHDTFVDETFYNRVEAVRIANQFLKVVYDDSKSLEEAHELSEWAAKH